MTYKVVLDSVNNGYNLATINANFQKIADILNRQVLWRDNPDDTANTIKDNIDFNGKRIYNLPAPAHLSEPVRMADLVAALQGVDVSTIPIPPLAPPPAEPPAPPSEDVVAQFTASATSGTVPLTVVFTNLSTGSPSSYAWDFNGDSVVDSTALSPSFTYTSPGSYAVSLTASKPGSTDTETKTAYINVTSVPPAPPPPAPSPSPSPPVVEFYADKTTGIAPLTVVFTDNSSNTPTSWAWDIDNNGSTDATTSSVTHTYTAPGTYSVKLTATNAGGSGNITKVGYITVSAPPVVPGPGAEFSGSPRTGQSVIYSSFTDLSTGSPTAWSWNFGNGVTSTLQNPGPITFTHSGNQANDTEYFTVSLTVSNAGGSSTITKTNYISVDLPFPGGA